MERIELFIFSYVHAHGNKKLNCYILQQKTSLYAPLRVINVIENQPLKCFWNEIFPPLLLWQETILPQLFPRLQCY